MTSLIEDRAGTLFKDLKQLFCNLPVGRRVLFTFDGWTSLSMTPFVAVTAHFVSKDWHLQRHLLSFSELPGSHNAKNIAKHIYTVIHEYGLADRVREAELHLNDGILLMQYVLDYEYYVR